MAEPNETAPLLATGDNHAEASGSSNNITSFPEITTYTAARDYFQRPFKIITFRILIISIISFIILVAADIFLHFAPFDWGFYAEHFNVSAGAFVFLAFLVALLNLRAKPPIWLNILIDILLLYCLLIWLSEAPLSSYFPHDSWCARVTSKPGCLNYVLAAKILMGIGGGLAAIVWFLHLALLVLRCVAAWKSKFWRRPAGFMIPTGELTFQFTIKLLRQETGGALPGAGSVMSHQRTSDGA